ncbi:MAG: PspA/IM30 family protein, partial [Sphaerochaetaceae bacterium]|nr:PspA/IM30 family protein [Sphaerochaetaceae bacterium]
MIRWENRATVAVENGQDDLAREALLEKRDCEEKVKNLEEQLSNYKAIGESQEAQLAQVVEKLSEVKAKEKTLIARARHAKEKQEVAKALEKCDCYKTMNRFNEMESRIERMEAKANMTYTNKTDCQFSKMEEEEEIEKELEKLKEKNK